MGCVLESVDNGVIHDALFEIFLPHTCLTCNKRYTTPGLLQEHFNVCIQVQVDAEDNLFIDYSTMSVKNSRLKLKPEGLHVLASQRNMILLPFLNKAIQISNLITYDLKRLRPMRLKKW